MPRLLDNTIRHSKQRTYYPFCFSICTVQYKVNTMLSIILQCGLLSYITLACAETKLTNRVYFRVKTVRKITHNLLAANQTIKINETIKTQ